ncbi:MAG: hypothetical protein WA477_00780 [Candidatus Sulfotelmatobacter sp.]
MSEIARIPDLVEDALGDTSAAAPGLHVVEAIETASVAARWWRIADFGVLSVWIAIVAFTLQYHEKWADEAQAWLIARDLGLKTIWFHELRYEGSPGLWHTILWIAQHVFHARYDALGYIGMAGATAGVALLIFKAPFPRYIRWPLAFTYFLVYQYAVIARPYTMLPLLAFSAALLFKDLEHPERMTIVLVLLANLSLHGTILAGCLGLVYVMDAYRARARLDARVRRNYWICIGIMAAVLVFIMIILKPTPDVAEFATAKVPQRVAPPTEAVKLAGAFCGAFCDYLFPSVLFVLLAGVWCLMRGRFLTYALPIALLFTLYGAVHGYAHHHGTMFLAAIAGIWIAWPLEGEHLRPYERRATQLMVGLMLCLCGINIWDSLVTIRREYLYPYSGAEDAAKYLKAMWADREPTFGYLFGVVGVQAYFDHNILANSPTSFYHQGVPLMATALDVEELKRANPEYVIAYSVDPQLMLDTDGPVWQSLGYDLVHFSDGYYLYKRLVYQRETYLIFRRMRP